MSIEELDVSGGGNNGDRFDIVDAVDVLFHVVDDKRWRRAVENLGHHLAPGGLLMIVEYVAPISYDAGLRPPTPSAASRSATKSSWLPNAPGRYASGRLAAERRV